MESNSSNAEIIAEFKKKRTRQIMAVGPIILAFIALLSVENNPTGIFGLPPSPHRFASCGTATGLSRWPQTNRAAFWNLS